MRVTIAADLTDRLVAEAASSADREICGILFGDDDRIALARSTTNIAADPAATFEIDPAALIAALKAERAGGPRVIGCYHSHPNGLPTPSPRDVAAAQAGSLWLIIGGGEARLWRAIGAGFEAVELARA